MGMLTALGDIVRALRPADAGGRTPSDFPLVRLDQAAVDRSPGRPGRRGPSIR
ncbi:hypothetical protein [Streptomyces echinatus]|uniref:hypothetical protein n=1 Tax=Streptomyces echinatus TaxID=67293 RepID=UPI0031EC8720